MPLHVDVATGATSLYEEDLHLPGYFPLVLARQYRSDIARRGPLGYGWALNLDVELRIEGDLITYRDAVDRLIHFRPIEVGMQATHGETRHVLEHHADAYVVYQSPLWKQVFLKQQASGGVVRLDRIEGPPPHTIRLIYKGRHLIGLIDSVGRQVQCTYANDLLASMELVGPDGKERAPVRTFRYEGEDLVGSVDATGRSTHYSYQDHLMVTYTNRLGGTQHAQYDADRRCLACWNGDGSLVRRVAYDALRQVTRVTHTDGHQFTYRHLGGQIHTRIDPKAQHLHYYYDEARRLMSIAPEGEALATLQQRSDDAFVQVDAERRAAFFTLNEQGLAQDVEDAAGNVYTLAYNDTGHPVRLIMPDEAVWRFERDKEGRVTSIISPEERRVRLSYDAGGRTRTIKDDLGVRFSEQYDWWGRLVERTDALGRSEQRTYDAAGQLTMVKVGTGYEVRFSYDAAGHLTAVTDSRRRDFKLQYDAFGRLTARTGPDGRRWSFQRDAEGRLTAIADGTGRTARYAYDVRGRLVSCQTLEGHKEIWAYTDAEVAVRRQGADGAARKNSMLHEVLKETTADGTSRQFSYGGSGEMLTAATQGGTASFEYDPSGRLVRVEAEAGLVELTYDRDGCLIALDAPATGAHVDLKRDQRGRIEAIQVDGLSVGRLAYDDAGRMTMLHGAEAHAIHLTYDVLDRLQERRMEQEGQSPDHRRFSSKDTTVQVDALPHPGDGASWGELYQQRHGLVLAVSVGALTIPVLVQCHFFSDIRADPAVPIIAAQVHSVEAMVQAMTLPLGLALARRWTQATDARLLFDIPAAADVGMPWPVLDRFFLRRASFDAAYPQDVPGYMLNQHNQAAGLLENLWMGTPPPGYRRAPAWTCRQDVAASAWAMLGEPAPNSVADQLMDTR